MCSCARIKMRMISSGFEGFFLCMPGSGPCVELALVASNRALRTSVRRMQ